MVFNTRHNVSLSSVSTRWTSFISVLAERPRMLETLSKTSNSMSQNLPLCSHSSEARPSVLSQCPPKAMSLEFDFTRLLLG